MVSGDAGAGIAEADIAPLLMVLALAQRTGDVAILDEVAPHVHAQAAPQ